MHTPGDWQVFESTDKESKPGDFTVWLGEYEKPCIARGVLTFADATLIAIAPKLLRAARHILAWNDGAGFICNGDEPLDELRAVIAEAHNA